jgi:signal recognition particle receptor subunit beta
MSYINIGIREIQCKIVYYGPARCGKTTNLTYIHSNLRNNVKGKMLSIDTKADKTLFFDFLPLELGKIGEFSIRIQLYTVPGQVHYNATRKVVLKGVDGVVFVADSLDARRERNIESLQNLIENLKDEGISIWDIPLVMQFNKRDLEGSALSILPTRVLERDLNSKLKVPIFLGSALEGFGVFETLRVISKLVVKEVGHKAIKSGMANATNA